MWTPLNSEGIPPAQYSQSTWSDMNRDGKMDLVLSGEDINGQHLLQVLINQGGNPIRFTSQSSGIGYWKNARTETCDYNRDGYADLLVRGKRSDNTWEVAIFENKKGNSYQKSLSEKSESRPYACWLDLNSARGKVLYLLARKEDKYVQQFLVQGPNGWDALSHNLPPLSSCSSALTVDINKNGKKELLLSGIDIYARTVLDFYSASLNGNTLSFTPVNSGFSGITEARGYTTDYNHDGFRDLLLIGKSNNKCKSVLYRNEHGIFITEQSVSVPALKNESFHCSDFNNDGYRDWVLSGTDDKGRYVSRLYQGSNTGPVLKNNPLDETYAKGSLCFLDVDGDEQIELYANGLTYNGIKSKFYKLSTPAPLSTAPQPPEKLQSSTNFHRVSLKWERTEDQEAKKELMGSFIRLGTSPGASDILRAPVHIGQIQTLTSKGLSAKRYELDSLPEGKYYWSACQVDPTLKASSFSAENNFTVCAPINIQNDTAVCKGDKLVLSYDKKFKSIQWKTKNKGIVGTNTKTIEFTAESTDTVYVELVKPLGCTVYDTIRIKVLALPALSLKNQYSACFGSELKLSASAETDIKTVWKNQNGEILSSENTYNLTVLKNQTVNCTVTTAKGCSSSQSATIKKLTLPSLITQKEFKACLGEQKKIQLPDGLSQSVWLSKNRGELGKNVTAVTVSFDENDTLFVTATDKNSCQNTDTVLLKTHALPKPDIGKNRLICKGSPISLNQPNTWKTISWHSDQRKIDNNTPSLYIPAAYDLEKIWVEVSDGHSCVNRDTLKVKGLDLPAFSLNDSYSVCKKEELKLTLSDPNWTTVSWLSKNQGNFSGESLSLPIQANDSVWATVTNAQGCLSKDSAAVKALSLPEYNLGKQLKACHKSQHELSVDNKSLSVVWKSEKLGTLATNQNTVKYIIGKTDIISAVLTDNNGCSSTENLDIVPLALPEFKLPEKRQICLNDAAELNTGKIAPLTVFWKNSRGETISKNHRINFTVTKQDTLIAQVTNMHSCAYTDSTVIIPLALPEPNLGINRKICRGTAVNLQAEGPWTSIEWRSKKNGVLNTTEKSVTRAVLEDDSVFVSVYNDLGCQNTDTVQIKALPLPEIRLGEDQAVCQKKSVKLQPVALNKSWKLSWLTTSGQELSQNESYTHAVQKTDTLILKATDSEGCRQQDSIIIRMKKLPVISLGADREVCLKENLSLSTGTWSRVKWTDSDHHVLSEKASLDFNVLKDKTLILEVENDSACVNTDTLFVKAIGLPEFSIGENQSICLNDSILLQVKGNWDKVSWLTKNKGKVLENQWYYRHKSTATDSIFAVVRNQKGCVNSDTVEIKTLSLPEFSLGEDLKVCQNSPFELKVNADIKNSVSWHSKWSGQIGIGSSYTGKASRHDEIWAKVQDTNGCVYQDSVQLTILELPKINLKKEQESCFGQTVQIGKSTPYAVEWRDGKGELISNESSFSVKALKTKRFIATATSKEQCQVQDTTLLTVHKLPKFSLGKDREACFGETIKVEVPDQFSIYQWTENGLPAENDQPSHSTLIKQTKEIVLQAANQHNCVNSDTVRISVIQLPVESAGEDQLVCFGEPVALSVKPKKEYSYRWKSVLHDKYLSENETLSFTSSATDKYVLFTADAKGCSGVPDTVKVEVNPPTVVRLDESPKICIGESLALGGSPTASGSNYPYQYIWTSGGNEVSRDANPTVRPRTDTQYELLVKTKACPDIVRKVLLTVNPLPKIALKDTLLTVGKGKTATLEATGAQEYFWRPDYEITEVNQRITEVTPKKTTVYTVEGIDGNGCKSTSRAKVQVIEELFIPELFTPNRDGKNDFFIVRGHGVKEIELGIYDMQGNRVAKLNSVRQAMETGWDGTQKGFKMPSGTYIWKLKGSFESGLPISCNGKDSGVFTLIR
ncbi:MAG: FG-GAP-like repeat-containing protein [Cytophagales bacterium]|nr:FG-GAP-like repeat-containing protein [Cytophagales bacterium]